MKFKMILPMVPVFLALFMFAGSKSAQAVDVNVQLGGGHHYRGGNVVEYRTVDPVYNTWYPDTTQSYVYTSPTTSYDSGYSSGYSTGPYIYSTETSSYGGWYGGGRSGHGGYYGDRRGGGYRHR